MQQESRNEFCEKCSHTGWILDRKTNIAVRCDCTRLTNLENRLNKAEIPKRYSNCSLDNFDVMESNRSFSSALKSSKDFVKRYPKTKKGLLFMGASGVGKTHLAVGIIKALVYDKGIDCLFIDFQELLRNIQSSYNPDSGTTEARLLDPVLNIDLLLIDDLGSKAATEWMRDTLAYIINHRYNNQKISLFTTNYFDEDKSEKDYTLADRIGARIRSRLYEMTDRIYMEGDDFRREFR